MAARTAVTQLPGPRPCSCQDLSHAAVRTSAMYLPGPRPCSCQDLGHMAARTSAMQLPGPEPRSPSGKILAWKPFPKMRFSRLLKA